MPINSWGNEHATKTPHAHAALRSSYFIALTFLRTTKAPLTSCSFIVPLLCDSAVVGVCTSQLDRQHPPAGGRADRARRRHDDEWQLGPRRLEDRAACASAQRRRGDDNHDRSRAARRARCAEGRGAARRSPSMAANTAACRPPRRRRDVSAVPCACWSAAGRRRGVRRRRAAVATAGRRKFGHSRPRVNIRFKGPCACPTLRHALERGWRKEELQNGGQSLPRHDLQNGALALLRYGRPPDPARPQHHQLPSPIRHAPPRDFSMQTAPTSSRCRCFVTLRPRRSFRRPGG